MYMFDQYYSILLLMVRVTWNTLYIKIGIVCVLDSCRSYPENQNDVKNQTVSLVLLTIVKKK